MRLFLKNRDCLKIAFTDLIQTDLNRMMIAWNTHRIRHNVNSNTNGSGIPDELFYLPEIRGSYYLASQYKKVVGDLSILFIQDTVIML